MIGNDGGEFLFLYKSHDSFVFCIIEGIKTTSPSIANSSNIGYQVMHPFVELVGFVVPYLVNLGKLWDFEYEVAFACVLRRCDVIRRGDGKGCFDVFCSCIGLFDILIVTLYSA